MKKFAVIVAGGSGSRMKSAVPKQFLLLNNVPVLMHTLFRFYESDPSISIVLVLPEIHIQYWKDLCLQHAFAVPHQVIPGGNTRFHSVKKGLQSIKENGMVAIHDAVRPLVTIDLINRLFEDAGKFGNAVPVIPVKETLRKLEGDTSQTADRSLFRIVQTPQVFDVMKLQNAFEQSYTDSFTDDASVMEWYGEKIFLSQGEPSNIKITTPEDLLLAAEILKDKV